MCTARDNIKYYKKTMIFTWILVCVFSHGMFTHKRLLYILILSFYLSCLNMLPWSTFLYVNLITTTIPNVQFKTKLKVLRNTY